MLRPPDEPELDPDWYAAAYPAAAEDVARGRAADLHDHYRRLGRFRGYLPRSGGERGANPATHRSAFGGLWIDLANAADLLEGKRELGWIDDRQHALLSAFIRDGYVILPGAVPEPILSAARQALEDAYQGRDEGQAFLCETLPEPWTRWRPELLQHPAKAVEIHWRAPALRDAAFSPAIAEFLSLIFERPPLLTQSLGFWRGSGQAVHQDSAYVGYSLYTQFAASWVALEDVAPGAGELCYYPGSQRFPEHLFLDRFKGSWEAARWKAANGLEGGVGAKLYERTLPEKAAAQGVELETFRAKAGDALIWAADLVHGGSAISTAHTRKSLVSHYCPREIAPCYFEEHGGRQRRPHPSGCWYTSWLPEADHK
jgi:hypothetical protein